MANKFKVGDVVYLREDSTWFGVGNNPADDSIQGTVVDVFAQDGNAGWPMPYKVVWSNMLPNSYREYDLEHVLPSLSAMTDEQLLALKAVNAVVDISDMPLELRERIVKVRYPVGSPDKIAWHLGRGASEVFDGYSFSSSSRYGEQFAVERGVPFVHWSKLFRE